VCAHQKKRILDCGALNIAFSLRLSLCHAVGMQGT
jgi:hypothetical protein